MALCMAPHIFTPKFSLIFTQIRTFALTSVCWMGKGKRKPPNFDRSIEKYGKRFTEKRGKKPWYDTPSPSSGGGSTWLRKSTNVTSIGTQRRMKQLSSILYEKITGVIYNGEVDPRLVTLGLEVVQVRVTPDFSNINIHWEATGSDKDQEIEELLEEARWKIRSILTNMYVMGHIPPVQFVKDLSTAKLQEVERLLEKADMGEDFTPTDLGHDMKSHDTLHSKYISEKYSGKLNPSNIEIQNELQKTAANLAHKDMFGRSGHFREGMESNMYHGATSSLNDVTSSDKQSDSDSDRMNKIDEQTRPSHTRDDSLHSVKNLNLRSDVYNLDHQSITNKLLVAKSQGKAISFSKPFVVNIDTKGNTLTSDFKETKAYVGKHKSEVLKPKEKNNMLNYRYYQEPVDPDTWEGEGYEDEEDSWEENSLDEK